MSTAIDTTAPTRVLAGRAPQIPFVELPNPRDDARRPRPQYGLGATWVADNHQTGQRRLVACYVPREAGTDIDELAAMLGLIRINRGVAVHPFGLDCQLVDGVISITGFDTCYFQFRALDEAGCVVVDERREVLLLVSGKPVADAELGVRGLDPASLWAARVPVSRIDPGE